MVSQIRHNQMANFVWIFINPFGTYAPFYGSSSDRAPAQVPEDIREIFFRKKFDPYTTIEERTEFLHYFFQQATKIEITKTVSICRDPKDNMILELDVSGQADVIITGDKDLLALSTFEGVSILSPEDFLQSAWYNFIHLCPNIRQFVRAKRKYPLQ